MNVLLISPYDTDSHRFWRNRLTCNLKEVSFDTVTLPGRYFSWRSRGSAINLLTKKELFLGRSYDRVLTTSMLDIAGFRGLFSEFSSLPITTYFHENQFEYPVSSNQQSSAELQVWSLYNALLSDRIVFNSKYNMDTFYSGLELFLKKMPDLVPKNIVKNLSSKSEVIPVPIELPMDFGAKIEQTPKMRILWNHRWDYDKAPERFLLALSILKQRGVEFELVLLGKGRVHSEILSELKEQIVHSGYVESRKRYVELVSSCNYVVSSALHEFQGVSVLEAVSYGCTPILPDRVVYPHIFPKNYLYESNLNDGLREASSLADLLTSFNEGKTHADFSELKNILKGYSFDSLKESYLNCLR